MSPRPDDDGDDAEEDQPELEYPKLQEMPKITEKNLKMPWFKLESSKQGQKKKDKKVEKDITDMLNCLDIDDERDENEESMYTVGQCWTGNGRVGEDRQRVGQWHRRPRGSHTTSPNVRIMPSAGSKRGQSTTRRKGMPCR